MTPIVATDWPWGDLEPLCPVCPHSFWSCPAPVRGMGEGGGQPAVASTLPRILVLVLEMENSATGEQLILPWAVLICCEQGV